MTLEDKLAIILTSNAAVQVFSDVFTALENLEDNIVKEHKCMTGQDWFDKFTENISQLKDFKFGKFMSIEEHVLEAAKKAAGIE